MKMLSDNVPEDLMKEILVRLPVESLLRFKSVAKSWYALITDPSFIEKHVERSNSITKNRGLKLFFRVYGMNKWVPNISLISKDQPYCVGDIEPLPNRQCWGFYGQCNGIFCLNVIDFNVMEEVGNSGDLILWNPTTKQVKLIPVSSMSSNMFGFGFDPITKGYKVVQFPHPPLKGGGVHVAKVYNLSTNSWKILEVVVPYLESCHPDYKYYLNGVFHWYDYYTSPTKRNFILTFDFTKEVFGTIELPSAIDSFYGVFVFILDQSLAILDYDCRTQRSKIWVMDEYGVESSWSNKFNIGSLPGITLLDSWGEDEILIQQYGEVISYNLQDHHINRLQVYDPAMIRSFDYVESVVPLVERKHNTDS